MKKRRQKTKQKTKNIKKQQKRGGRNGTHPNFSFSFLVNRVEIIHIVDLMS